jgi:hypothetical protein
MTGTPSRVSRTSSSTPSQPASSAASKLGEGFSGAASGNPIENLSYKNVFRLLIVDFMDAYNFDLRTVRKSCVHILHPDGKRAIPFETYNLLYRDDLEKTVLAEIRKERQSEIVRGPFAVDGSR